jgi:hypothetical protein
VPAPGPDISVDSRERRSLALGADGGSRWEPLQVRVEGGGMRDTHLSGADKGWVGAVFLPLSS